MKKIAFAATVLSSFVLTAIGQQQQSPFQPPATSPPQLPLPNAGQPTTPANPSVPTNPNGDAISQSVPTGSAPLFLTVTPMPVADANGQALGTLQQISLGGNGTINFGLVNIGGRLVPVPWQLVATAAPGRAGLSINTDRSVLLAAPAVAVSQLPFLAQPDVQERILVHFASQLPGGNTNAARGGVGSAGGTVTGGGTNFTSPAATNAGRMTNTNQPVNTTGGLLSPSGRTNGIQDLHRSGPGSAVPTTPPATGQPPPAQPRQQQR